MPELVQLEKRLRDRGFVVLGINFDNEVEKARKAVEKHGLRFPQVHALSAANDDRKLWRDAASISGLPRILIVDRKGILRKDVYPHNLAAHVEKLLDEKVEQRP